jgi:hypothetical protein
VYFRHAAQKTHLVFDNENLLAAAGVEPAMRLADAAGLDRLAAGHVRVAGPQAASTPLKIGCLVTGEGRTVVGQSSGTGSAAWSPVSSATP